MAEALTLTLRSGDEGGHRLGINDIAVSGRSMYTAGRDGTVRGPGTNRRIPSHTQPE